MNSSESSTKTFETVADSPIVRNSSLQLDHFDEGMDQILDQGLLDRPTGPSVIPQKGGQLREIVSLIRGVALLVLTALVCLQLIYDAQAKLRFPSQVFSLASIQISYFSFQGCEKSNECNEDERCDDCQSENWLKAHVFGPIKDRIHLHHGQKEDQ